MGSKKNLLFLPMLPKKAQITSREASTDCLAIASSSVLGLKMAFLDKIATFRPNIELEAIARQSVEASRKVICAYFGMIGRNSRYLNLNAHCFKVSIFDLLFWTFLSCTTKTSAFVCGTMKCKV